jgi:hypothetical protein
MSDLYCQCVLSRKTSRETTAYSVEWIPKRYAVPGRVLKILHNGVWVGGWRVEEIGTIGPRPRHWRLTVRDHRRTTGDALPKQRSE